MKIFLEISMANEVELKQIIKDDAAYLLAYLCLKDTDTWLADLEHCVNYKNFINECNTMKLDDTSSDDEDALPGDEETKSTPATEQSSYNGLPPELIDLCCKKINDKYGKGLLLNVSTPEECDALNVELQRDINTALFESFPPTEHEVTPKVEIAPEHKAVPKARATSEKEIVLAIESDTETEATPEYTPLMEAALRGDIKCVRHLLDTRKGQDAYESFEYNSFHVSALSCAAQCENLEKGMECFELIFARLSSDHDNYDNIIFGAVIHLEKHSSPAANKCLQQFLTRITSKNSEKIKQVLKRYYANYRPGQVDSYNYVFGLLYFNQPSYIASSIRKKSDLKKPIFANLNILQLEALLGHDMCVSYLLEKMRHVRDEPTADYLLTILNLAISQDHVSVVKALLSWCVSHNRYWSKRTLNQSLPNAKSENMIQLLLQYGADINGLESFRIPNITFPITMSALHVAALHDNLTAATYLLKNGANIKNNYCGFTAMHAAALGGKLRMVKFLLKIGADLNATYGNEYSLPKYTIEAETTTPLTAAIANKHENIALYLISQGAAIGVEDILLAIRTNQSNTLDALLTNASFLRPGEYTYSICDLDVDNIINYAKDYKVAPHHIEALKKMVKKEEKEFGNFNSLVESILEKDDIKAMREILKRPGDFHINEHKHKNEVSMLSTMALLGHVECVRLLLEDGRANAFSCTAGMTALTLTLRVVDNSTPEKAESIANLLLDKAQSQLTPYQLQGFLSQSCKHGKTALQAAVRNDLKALVNRLIELGANETKVGTKFVAGRLTYRTESTLHNALLYAKTLKMMQLLRSYRADIHSLSDDDKKSLLFSAADSEDCDLLKFVIKRGNIEGIKSKLTGALVHAKTVRILKLLISNGADINSLSQDDKASLLCRAAESDDDHMLAYILQTFDFDSNLQSALVSAISNNKDKAGIHLINAAKDISSVLQATRVYIYRNWEILGQSDHSILYYAISNNRSSIVDTLKRAGATLTEKEHEKLLTLAKPNKATTEYLREKKSPWAFRGLWHSQRTLREDKTTDKEESSHCVIS